jgi:hypothetical protein
LKDAAVVAIHYPNKEEHNFILNKLVEWNDTIRHALECTVVLPAKPDDDTVHQFLNYPASQKILDAVLKTVEYIPSSVSSSR